MYRNQILRCADAIECINLCRCCVTEIKDSLLICVTYYSGTILGLYFSLLHYHNHTISPFLSACLPFISLPSLLRACNSLSWSGRCASGLFHGCTSDSANVQYRSPAPMDRKPLMRNTFFHCSVD